MTETLAFKAFCFEAYRAEKKLGGSDTMALFKKYGVLDYLESFFDVLHATGREYMIEDIDKYIEVRRK